ncbi:MAG: hypothetical protein IJD86_04290, partial [Clostridia bacterium]|nr:hypothetical protein [Clostridia bacterium]
LTFHSDIVNLYHGMEEEYVLPPDVCAYYAIPRNAERERQEWTNHDLRELCHQLKKQGTGLYMSIMGSYLNNMFHQEWLSDYPELRVVGRNGLGGLNCLKRFKDGTYFQEYFSEKLAGALYDYGFEGVHITDGFCPMGSTRNMNDFSTDMVEQFIEHTGIALPEEIAREMGDDEPEAASRRGDWLWDCVREQWLRFMTWRWEKFFEVICEKVHAVGKKVFVLGMYCTDPFESLYLMGFDIKAVIRAGVDYIMPNILPTSVYMGQGGMNTPRYFHRYMNIIPMAKAQTPEGKYLSMLGVQDASEQWSVLHHAPCKIERDAYTMFSFQYVDRDGCQRAMDGLMACLGDGIPCEDWAWLNERLDIAFELEPKSVESPIVVWSDAGHDKLLGDYIKTRRWSHHKLVYQMASHGALVGGSTRVEEVPYITGPLFVPNFDLMPEAERKTIANYRGGKVLVIAGPDYAIEKDGIVPAKVFKDLYAPYALSMYVMGGDIDEETAKAAEALIAEKDDAQDLDMDNIVEIKSLLRGDIPFRKVSDGFQKAMALMINAIGGDIFTANVPMRAFKLDDKTYRLYLYGLYEERYSHGLVKSKKPIDKVNIISRFPVLPVRFVEELNESFLFTYEKGQKHSFQAKLQPGGATIVDVILE